MVHKQFIFQSVPVHYTSIGEGPHVVLVHGFAEDGSIWDKQVEELSAEFKVTVIDLPGSGRSVLMKEGSASDHTSIETMAEVINEMLRNENINLCTLIGHSMGGYVCLAFAEKYPENLNALGLFHSSAFADDKEKIDTRLKAIDHIKNYGIEAFLKTSFPNLFGTRFRKENSGIINELIQKYALFQPASLTGYYYAMINRIDRTAVLKELPKPILFIIGEEDAAIPLDASLKQCYLPLQSHVQILPETGHMGMIEEASKTSGILLEFCRMQASV